MPAKILLVDDEPTVLAGYERSLRREFEVDTANGGELGLKSMRERGPYATIISDMRMPGMSGAQFLAQARQMSPDTTRMLLTGYTDMNAAMDAVNEGHIYRFLTKPCAKEAMVAAINSGVEQYHRICSERELLEKTLLGSIKVLTDFLSAASPAAFARSVRIAHFVRYMAKHLGIEFGWRLQAAAMLSQLGCVTLDTELIHKALDGETMEADEQARFEAHARTAMRLLEGIPRLEVTSWIIGHQYALQIPEDAPDVADVSKNEIVLAAKVLKLAVAFDQLRVKISGEEAIARLHKRIAEFGHELFDALRVIPPMRGRMEARRVSSLRLTQGMVLDQDIRNKQGMLLVAKGQELNGALLIKLENFAKASLIEREVSVLVAP
jgi:response regulator RpfG family c-di-GMP phosphodiesterase